jgi:hypothetical protein
MLYQFPTCGGLKFKNFVCNMGMSVLHQGEKGIVHKFLDDFCLSSLELLQFCMLLHKIQRKNFNMYKILNFSKFAREISNFLTYLDCPHYV